MAHPHAEPPPPEKKHPPVGPRKKTTNEKEKALEPDQILKCQNGVEYLVENKLGQGGFGEVWKVSLLDDPDKRFAMKTEKNIGMHKEMKRLKCEVNLFEEIDKAPNSIEKRHFVKMHGKGKTSSFKYYIMDLIWLSLKDLKQNICGDVFSPHTKIKIGRQTLKGIEALHDIGYLHRDIKPANYAVGLPPKDSIVYLLDFGIARPYKDKDGVIRKPRKRVRGLGTQLYMSMECLCQNEQARRDDLEVWMYMMIEFYDRMNLLWWNLEASEAQQAMNLREELMQKPRELLADGRLKVPEKWCDIIDLLNGMAFEEPGDFVQINLFLTQICIDENIDENLPFDWAGKKAKSPERPKKAEEKKKDKKVGVRKKKTAEIKEVKEEEPKKDKKPPPPPAPKGVPAPPKSDDSEIGSADENSADDYQNYLRWKKKRRSRRKKSKNKSNDNSEKGGKGARKKTVEKKDDEPAGGSGGQKVVDSNEGLDAKKEEKLVEFTPDKTPEKFEKPDKKRSQEEEKKAAPKKKMEKLPEPEPLVLDRNRGPKVEPTRNSHGTPESNESYGRDPAPPKEKFGSLKRDNKKRGKGTGSKGSADDDDKEYQRKKAFGVRKRETNKTDNKKPDRKKPTKRKSFDDGMEDKKMFEKSPAAKAAAPEPKKAAEIKKK